MDCSTDLSGAERAKYEKVWAHERYRKFSPGENLVDEARSMLGMHTGDTVIDFGCGTGRAAAKFKALGHPVRGVDIAENCLEADIPFIHACLWDMPIIVADWGFCTDVMEHIPEEKVDAVLAQIRARTERGAFFQIHLRKDGFGPEILGEPLHLTVKPAQWWKGRLDAAWPRVFLKERGSQAIFACHV